MREEIWTEKIFKDDAGYFLRITKFDISTSFLFFHEFFDLLHPGLRSFRQAVHLIAEGGRKASHVTGFEQVVVGGQ